MTIQTLLNVNTVFISPLGYPMSYLEFFGTVSNLACVWLAAKNKISTWGVGILGIVLYIFLFYQIQLYSDVLEQFYFLVMSFYGWWLWIKIGKKKNWESENKSGIKISSKKTNLITSGLIVIGTLLLTALTSNLNKLLPTIFAIPASYPMLDAFTTVLSIAATILLAKKVIESWYLWILVDVIGIWLYYVKGVKFISLEYVLFLGMAFYGLYDWLRTLKKEGKIKTIWLKVW